VVDAVLLRSMTSVGAPVILANQSVVRNSAGMRS
jgi:hypothetical protein